jgi:hypothetical protein
MDKAKGRTGQNMGGKAEHSLSREGTGKEQVSDKRRRNWRGAGAVVIRRAGEGAGSGSTSGCGPEMREGGCCAACDL